MKPLKSLLLEQPGPLIIFLCVLAVYGLSWYQRQASYTAWLADSGEYVVEEVTALATVDAYWWVKSARDLDAGKTGKKLQQDGRPLHDPLKEYPDLNIYPKEHSLLARFISLAGHVTGGDYYRAGLLLPPLLAGLFVFPLLLYCHTLGFGASAVLGGLIGSFSWAYYSRSAMGFVDTDLLNLFFPMTVSALLLLIRRERPPRANLLLAAGAGLTMFLFNWWYQQPVFTLVYLLFFALYLGLLRLPWKPAAWLLLVFAVASGPGYLLQSATSLQLFLGGYFLPRATGQIAWPDVMTTIQESRVSDLATKLRDLYDLLPVVIAGLAGLLWLCVIRWRQMVPIAPLLLIGAWSLVGPSRFTMYLAPFIGVGVGVLIELLAGLAGRSFKLKPLATTLLAVALMAALFFSTLGYNAYHWIPAPAVPAERVRAFLEIKRRVPPHSPMLTWWAGGYPLMEIGEFATYHDNSAHGGLRSTLIAKALTSPRQEELAALLACLEDYGFRGLNALIVERQLSGEQLVAMALNHPAGMKKENVFVLYTHDMIESFEALSVSGTWDFTRKTSSPMRYTTLPFFSQAGDLINFRGGQIDLGQGTIRDETTIVPILAALFVRDGQVVERIDYPAAKGVYLQVLIRRNQVPELQVVEEPLFRTNFNQQFILGNYDRDRFEEVYNHYPVARVFRVKGGM